MTAPSADSLRSALSDLVTRTAAADVTLPDSATAHLTDYLTLLIDWSERINLVSRKELGAVVEKHVGPSLAPLLAERFLAEESVELLDVGSGGGFPGLVIGIARPAWSVCLVESIRKKALFLDRAARPHANIRVLRERVELLAKDPDHAARYDIVTARAVAPPDEIWPMVRGLIVPGGEAHVFAPRRTVEETLARLRERFDDLSNVSALEPEWHPGVVIRMTSKEGLS